MAIDLLKEYLIEYSSSILFISGIVLLLVGLLFLETFGSLLSASAIFFGIIFVAWGLFSRLGFYYLKLRSLNGLGTILISLSVVFLALSVTVMTFLSVREMVPYAVYLRGILLGYGVITYTFRPYAWVASISLWAFIISLIAGAVVKVLASTR